MGHMKRPLWFISVPLLTVGLTANAQIFPPTFAHGVDYRFQRIQATRKTSDTADQGVITLVSYVYTPLKLDRHEVVLFSHGSTSGGTVAPSESVAPPRSIVQFFVSRGYTLVAPMRRGRGESGGAYREECGVWSGTCTLADETALFASGLDEGALDDAAVIEQVVLGKLVPGNSKILFAGNSRGGFLSLVMAARRPEVTKGVINFVGGWFSVRDDYPPELNRMRLKLQTDRLASLAGATFAPTLWIYAARDPYYDEAVTRQFFESFTGAGGKGDYFYVQSHALPMGHSVGTDSALWQQRVDAFLNGLDAPVVRAPQ
jgi:pimeloyl-ACP methyl ester carboxylesterase